MSESFVKSLFIYPLKSAQGLAVETLTVDEAGPQYDREWMLVKKSNGSFISQRTHPMMSQLATEFKDQHLIIKSTGFDNLAIPLSERSSTPVEVSLFGKTVIAEKVGAGFDKWFSDVLKSEVLLVRTPKENHRTTSGRNGPKTSIRFPDGYPFLLTNTATLAELNSRLEQPVTMARFRPNIVIENDRADSEDQWKSFRVGTVDFLAVKACTRCAVIDVDPQTGQRSPGVSSTLKKYRTNEGGILFGMNLSHTSTGHLQAGDRVESISEK